LLAKLDWPLLALLALLASPLLALPLLALPAGSCWPYLLALPAGPAGRADFAPGGPDDLGGGPDLVRPCVMTLFVWPWLVY
jgi:hypothetical protein